MCCCYQGHNKEMAFHRVPFKSDELWVLGGLAHSDLKVREGLRKNTAQHRRTQATHKMSHSHPDLF